LSEVVVAVDMRMAAQSGIGRYVTELVSRMVPGSGIDWKLIGDADVIRRAVPESANDGGGRTEIVPLLTPIYTAREQITIPRAIPSRTGLFWSPHYNIPIFRGGRLLVTVHDVLHLARPRFVEGAHRRAYARLMFGAVSRKATRIICVSEHTASEVMRYTGVSASRIRVIHNGVTPGWGAPSSEPTETPPYLLAVGNVKPHKNLGVLMAAFEAMRDEIRHDLVIVGRKDGFQTGDANVVQRAAGMGGRVRFTGEVSDAELGRYLRNADALVFPSLYEGFGLPPLEAMAAGCPVVCSNAASLPEVCGGAALYFDPTNPLELVARLRELLSDPALADDLRARGRERAALFSWERCAEETRKVLEEALVS
jgi:glycosyltransferase involved in cell wall biosynthesis